MYQMYQFGIVKTEYFLILKMANSLPALFIFTESLIPTIFPIYELLSMNGCKYLQKKDMCLLHKKPRYCGCSPLEIF